MATHFDGLDKFYPYNNDGHLTAPVNWVPVWLHDAEGGVPNLAIDHLMLRLVHIGGT